MFRCLAPHVIKLKSDDLMSFDAFEFVLEASIAHNGLNRIFEPKREMAKFIIMDDQHVR